MGELFCSMGAKILVDDNELLVWWKNFEELFRVLLRLETVIFMLSNGRERGDGVEE